MHPVIAAVIVASGVIVIWGGYEVATRIYNEYQERQQYEEYVRQYSDYEKLDDDDDDDDDDDRFTAVGSDYLSRRREQLRNRRAHYPRSTQSASNSSELHLERSSYELDEFEKNLEERRRRLAAEQEMLDQAERDLVRRREVLASTTISSDNERHLDQHELNPIINSFIIPSPLSSSSSLDGDEPRSPTTDGVHDDDDSRSSVTFSHLSEGDLQSQDGGHSSSVSYDMLTDDDFHSTS